MADNDNTPVAGLEPLRQKAIDALCETFAQDQITVTDFERRVDLAHQAQSMADLRALLDDLPKAQTALTRPGPAGAVERPPRISPAGRTKEHEIMVGIFGGTSRVGHWFPARKSVAIGIMGGAKLDYREADLPPGVTEVTAIAVMGGVEIIVPPHVIVDVSGLAIMGGFDHRSEEPPTHDPDAPILKVNGFALMGGVEIKTRYPGETQRQARQRRRALRRAEREDDRS
ncbi:MAG: DUF1707 domain-containing protein [Gemmatimonadota bacterium]|nr:DUF1707 and DUF2154 domain-containing protein [Gemmatimonadota bacterium]